MFLVGSREVKKRLSFGGDGAGRSEVLGKEVEVGRVVADCSGGVEGSEWG